MLLLLHQVPFAATIPYIRNQKTVFSFFHTIPLLARVLVIEIAAMGKSLPTHQVGIPHISVAENR